MRFGGLCAVNDLSFAVAEGAIHGLIGPNGAGKTTVFNIISGYYTPTAGRVIFDGANIAGMKMHDVAARGVVRTFQHSSLFNEMTVWDNVLVSLHLSDRPNLKKALLPRARAESDSKKRQRVSELLDFFHLTDDKDKTAAQLPHGLQRALGIAIAMSAEPRLLLLDEPFTGMNPGETEQMMALTRRLRERGVTILLVEHDMRAVMGLCDKITVIHFGEILAEGDADRVAHHPLVIKAYLGRTQTEYPRHHPR